MNPALIDMRGARSRSSTVRLLLLLVVMNSATALALFGQENATPSGQAPPGQILMRQDDGRIVTLEEIGFPPEKVDLLLDWLTTQLSVRQFEIAHIEAAGNIKNGRAQLQVEFRIELLTADDWVRIPIGFESWTVISFQHQPEDPGFQSWFPGNTSGTREWHLKGQGSHVLKMDLISEVRDQEADRQRLKMSLPRHLISKLQLTFDEIVEGVRGNNGTRPVAESDSQQSTYTFWGLKPETEISWQALAQAGDREATVITAAEPASMILDLTTSRAALTCSQTVDIAGGAIEQLEVRLPRGYRQLEISGRDENGNLVAQPNQVSAAGDGSTAAIEFLKPVRGRLELRFDLELESTGFPLGISVSIPDIDGAMAQSATVEIRIPRGLDVDIVEESFTRRTRVDPQSDHPGEAMAFELLSTEASLQLDVREVEALFAVEPQLEFSSDDQGLLLLARFPVNVSPGSLDELLIDWNEYVEDGWQIIPGSIYLTVDGGSRRKLSRSESDDNSIRLPLESFQSGRFSVEFRAFRSTNDGADSDDGIMFFLPDINASASTGHPTIVSLVESDVYSLSLTKADDDSPFSIIPPRQVPGAEQPERATTWRVNDSDTRVRIRQTLQTQEVNSTATVALDARFDSVYVHAEVEIDVRHRDLRELRFTAPDGFIAPELQLSSHDAPLVPSESSADEIVWQLPEPIRGQHTASIDYLWTPGVTGEDNRLPLVLPSAGLVSLTIGTDIPDVLSVVEDRTLRRKFSRRFRAAWSTGEFRSEVALHIPRALQLHQSHDPLVCLVESRIDPFSVTTTTTAVFEDNPRSVLFRVPADVGVSSLVNGTAVDPVSIAIEEEDSGNELRLGRVYQVSVPSDLEHDPVRISLTCRIPRGPHHHLVSTADATYPRIVDAPDWLTTIWVVGSGGSTRVLSLNLDQQLAVSPLLTDVPLNLSADHSFQVVETALAGLPGSVGNQLLKQLESSAAMQRASFVFVARPEIQTIPLLIYSPAAGWAAAAVLAVSFYAVLSVFRCHLRLMTAILIPASVALWAVLPQQTVVLLFPVVPAVLAALIAWGFRQLVMPTRIQKRTRRRRKSIFASAPRTASALSHSDAMASSPPHTEIEASLR